MYSTVCDTDMKPKILIPEETKRAISVYHEALTAGKQVAGARVLKAFVDEGLEISSPDHLLRALLRSKKPQIFAESEVAGDGSDWNAVELRLLGDISVAMDVTIFDDGRHSSPKVHSHPFDGTLIFTPGALLRASGNHVPADWAEVVQPNGTLDSEAYDSLYERRLLPVFQHIESHCRASGRKAFVTIPGLGCGQFAGRFQGTLGVAFERSLKAFLERHGGSFSHIKAVYYDPYSECQQSRQEIHGIQFMVRPLLLSNGGKPQLCQPSDYAETDEEFSDCRLFSLVAWDHVSWPGNDFFGGSRCTDDGVKAAATNSMEVLTGGVGTYSAQRHAFMPPAPFRTWGELVAQRDIKFPDTKTGE